MGEPLSADVMQPKPPRKHYYPVARVQNENNRLNGLSAAANNGQTESTHTPGKKTVKIGFRRGRDRGIE